MPVSYTDVQKCSDPAERPLDRAVENDFCTSMYDGDADGVGKRWLHARADRSSVPRSAPREARFTCPSRRPSTATWRLARLDHHRTQLSAITGSPLVNPGPAMVHRPPRGVPPFHACRTQLRVASWPQ